MGSNPMTGVFERRVRDFPGGPGVETVDFQCGEEGLTLIQTPEDLELAIPRGPSLPTPAGKAHHKILPTLA